MNMSVNDVCGNVCQYVEDAGFISDGFAFVIIVAQARPGGGSNLICESNITEPLKVAQILTQCSEVFRQDIQQGGFSA